MGSALFTRGIFLLSVSFDILCLGKNKCCVMRVVRGILIMLQSDQAVIAGNYCKVLTLNLTTSVDVLSSKNLAAILSCKICIALEWMAN